MRGVEISPQFRLPLPILPQTITSYILSHPHHCLPPPITPTHFPSPLPFPQTTYPYPYPYLTLSLHYSCSLPYHCLLATPFTPTSLLPPPTSSIHSLHYPLPNPLNLPTPSHPSTTDYHLLTSPHLTSTACPLHSPTTAYPHLFSPLSTPPLPSLYHCLLIPIPLSLPTPSPPSTTSYPLLIPLHIPSPPSTTTYSSPSRCLPPPHPITTAYPFPSLYHCQPVPPPIPLPTPSPPSTTA